MHTSIILYRVNDEHEYHVIFYKTSQGRCPTDKFLDRLNMQVRAKVLKWIQLLQEHGPSLPRPYADYLGQSIYELRVGFGRLEIRLLYFFYKRTLVIISHGFLKKSANMPRTEIERALTAKSDWLERHGEDP